jgi:hypothetical protein
MISSGSASNSILVFADQMPGVFDATIMVANLVGFIMAGIGILKIGTKAGDRNQYWSHGMGMGFTLLLTGALMLNMSASIGVLTASFFGMGTTPMDPGVLGTGGGGNPIHVWTNALFNILIVIGWIMGVWGLVNLGIAGSRREKGLSAGISRLVVAVMLTNPHAFFSLVGGTFAIEEQVSIFVPTP